MTTTPELPIDPPAEPEPKVERGIALGNKILCELKELAGVLDEDGLLTGQWTYVLRRNTDVLAGILEEAESNAEAAGGE